MKKIMLLLPIVLVALSCNAQEKEFSKETLSHQLVTTDSTKVSFESILKKHKGKTVLIEVWASWCGDCVGAMPRVKEMQASNPNVDYVFLSMDKAFSKWKLGMEKHQLAGDHYWVDDAEGMKGAFGQSINLDWIPRYIILDKEGKIILFKATEKDFDKIQKKLNY